MKLITTLALALAVLPVLASAQTTTYRDAMGREIGSASTRGNVTTFRDWRGRETGTAERQPGGRIEFRDARGRELGTVTPRR